MNMNDDVILSCYLDGELDYARAAEVSDKIERNAYTRDRFVALATSQAQLRAYGQTHHNSAVPSHLTRIFQKDPKRNYFRLDQRGLMQLAVVLVVCVLSYFTGRQNNVDQSMQASLGPAIPTALEQTINSVLEYQKSGSDQGLSLIHISEPTRPRLVSRMPSSA